MSNTSEPPQEWLEKWMHELELAFCGAHEWGERDGEKLLTAIYREVYAKARRETLEEVQKKQREFLEGEVGRKYTPDYLDRWFAEQLKEEE